MVLHVFVMMKGYGVRRRGQTTLLIKFTFIFIEELLEKSSLNLQFYKRHFRQRLVCGLFIFLHYRNLSSVQSLSFTKVNIIMNWLVKDIFWASAGQCHLLKVPSRKSEVMTVRFLLVQWPCDTCTVQVAQSTNSSAWDCHSSKWVPWLLINAHFRAYSTAVARPTCNA